MRKHDMLDRKYNHTVLRSLLTQIGPYPQFKYTEHGLNYGGRTMTDFERMLIGHLNDDDRRKWYDSLNRRKKYFVFEVDEVGNPKLIHTCDDLSELYMLRYVGVKIIREYDYTVDDLIQPRPLK